jgi:hypothetical protein
MFELKKAKVWNIRIYGWQFSLFFFLIKRRKLCWDSDFQKVMYYLNSLLSINLIKEGVTIYHQFVNKVHCIYQLLAKNWNIVINYILFVRAMCARIFRSKWVWTLIWNLWRLLLIRIYKKVQLPFFLFFAIYFITKKEHDLMRV